MTYSAQALVTGGTGFIGRYVVRRLLQEGVAVRLFCRYPAKAQALFGSQIKVVTGNLNKITRLTEACHDIHTVFHLTNLYEFHTNQPHKL